MNETWNIYQAYEGRVYQIQIAMTSMS